MAVCVCVHCRNALSFSEASQLSFWLSSILPLILTLIVLCVGCVACALLCAYHTYLMFTSQTTWEQASRHSIPYLRDKVGNPFDEGCGRNVGRFVCGRANWEEVYQRTSGISVP